VTKKIALKTKTASASVKASAKQNLVPAKTKTASASVKASAKQNTSLKAAKAKVPETMEELLAQTGYVPKGIKTGELVEGVITEKTPRTVYIDIGGKTEGIISDREVKLAKDYIRSLQVGDKIKVVILQAESDKGQPLLSIKKAALDSTWEEFDQKLKIGEIVVVRGREVNRGGLIVDAKGLQGFIPTSQFGAKLSKRLEDLINRNIEVKTIEVDREKNRLIFSEREVSEASLLKAQEEALGKVKDGDVFDGVITGVMPFGLFVKVGDLGLEGLVHISEISWEKVEDPAKFYKQGDQAKVKVLAADKKLGKLNLSIKQLALDPWSIIEEKYQPETKAKGKVVRMAPFGAFVNLEPGIEGLIHISKIPAEKSVQVGDEVNCYVESVDKDHRRMSLGLVLAEKPVGYK